MIHLLPLDVPMSGYRELYCNLPQSLDGGVLSQWNNMYLKGDNKSVLIIRGTYYQGWFMYMRCAQRQNEEYLLSRSMY